jgi:trigger factor
MANKKNTNEVVVKIEGQAWKDAIDKAFNKKVKEITVPGFRKGKVPRAIYDKKYGKESLYLPASDYVIEEAYKKMLDESKLVPVVMPKADIKDVNDDKIEFVFTVITKPAVKIKNYKDLKVKKDAVKVTKDEINHEIGHLLERFSETKTKEKGSLENGNIAVIDFEGFKDGKPFDGGKAENYELEIGSNSFIPGFEEQLIGMKAEEEKEINVKFPEDYPHAELKGAPVVFKIKLHEIKEKVERKFDKELFEDLNIEGVDSKEKLEKHIEEDIKKGKEKEAEDAYVDKLLEAVAKNVDVDIPEEMVEEEIDRMVERYERQLKMQGASLEMFYSFSKMTEKDLRAQFEKEAYRNVLYRLMLEEIQKEEKIEVTDKEVDEELESMAKEYKMKKEDLIKSIGKTDMIKYDLEIRKVVDALKEYNK